MKMNRWYEAVWGGALCAGVLGSAGLVVLNFGTSGHANLYDSVGTPTWAVFFIQVASLLVVFGETDIAAWIRGSSYLKTELRLLYLSQYCLVAVSLFGGSFLSVSAIVGIGALLMLVSVAVCLRKSLLLFREISTESKSEENDPRS